MRVVFTVYSFISIAFSPMRLAPCAGKKQDACKLMPNVIAPQFFFHFYDLHCLFLFTIGFLPLMLCFLNKKCTRSKTNEKHC